jgi:hypothetical protein
VRRFNNLAVEERDQRFREATANIPPSRGRHGRRVVARRGGHAGGEVQEAPVQEAQQDARGVEIIVGSSPTIPHTRRMVLGRPFPPYPSLDTVADAAHERARIQSPPGGPSPNSIDTGASTLTVPSSSRHVAPREAQGELPGSRNQEASCVPGLEVIPGTPPPHHSPTEASPDPTPQPSDPHSPHSSHPSAGLTPFPGSPVEQMRQALELVREAIHRVNQSTHETPTEPSPSDTPPEPTNTYYREMLSDSWYHFKPDQHISYLKLRWEDPNNPTYARYLKPEVRAGNPTLLGSMGPGEPVYTDNLLAQPFHTAEPRGTTPQSFDLLANPLDPCIDRAIASLRDLGVTSEVFRLCQLPMRRLENARHMAYLEREKERIQREIGYLELGRKQLDTEEANIRRRLSAARVFMRISDHLEYDMEPGEVPPSVLYPQLTNRPARYISNTRSPATALRAAGVSR